MFSYLQGNDHRIKSRITALLKKKIEELATQQTYVTLEQLQSLAEELPEQLFLTRHEKECVEPVPKEIIVADIKEWIKHRYRKLIKEKGLEDRTIQEAVRKPKKTKQSSRVPLTKEEIDMTGLPVYAASDLPFGFLSLSKCREYGSPIGDEELPAGYSFIQRNQETIYYPVYDRRKEPLVTVKEINRAIQNETLYVQVVFSVLQQYKDLSAVFMLNPETKKYVLMKMSFLEKEKPFTPPYTGFKGDMSKKIKQIASKDFQRIKRNFLSSSISPDRIQGLSHQEFVHSLGEKQASRYLFLQPYNGNPMQPLDVIHKGCMVRKSIKAIELHRGIHAVCKHCQNMSVQERNIKLILERHRIPFLREFTLSQYEEVQNSPFDFAIIHNKQLLLLIEYDGEVHDVENYKRGGKATIDAVQAKDQLKTAFCQQHRIPLLRLHHSQKEELEEILIKEVIQKLFPERYQGSPGN